MIKKSLILLIKRLSYDVRYEEYSFFLDSIRSLKSRKVLDLACGSASFHSFLLDNNVDHEYTGIDSSQKNVDFCNLNGINVKKGNALNIPFDNNYDLIVCSHLIQYLNFSELLQLFYEVQRLLKPGGIFVLTTLTDFRKFYRHPENLKPYPAEAIMRIINSSIGGSTAAMHDETLNLIPKKIRYRYPPLFSMAVTAKDEINRKRITILFKSLMTYLQFKLKIKSFYPDAYSILFRKIM